MISDPIADTLTQIRNSQLAAHETVDFPHSRLRESIVNILAEEGYVNGFVVKDDEGPFKVIEVSLKYTDDRVPAIRRMRRVSRQGRRVYVGKDDIPLVLDGLGINILSTSQGLLTGKKAREAGVGGEILCEIY